MITHHIDAVAYAAGQQWIVGVDSYINYYNPLVAVSGLSLAGVLSVLSLTFHGAYVGFLYIAERVTGLNPFVIVKSAPLLLAILTSVLMFWLVVGSTRNHPLAVLSTLCCIFWIPTTAGIFCGFQANWTALLLWLLFLALMLRSMNRSTTTTASLLSQALISARILLIHPWTWGVIVVTLFIFTAILAVVKASRARRSVTSLFSSLVFAVPTAVVGMLLAPGIRNDTMRAIGLYLWTLSDPVRLRFFWNSVSTLLVNWGSFLSPLLLIVSLAGIVAVMRRGDTLGKYLLAWVIAWSIGSVLAAPIGYYPNQPQPSDPTIWRMLFVSPLPILLTFGVGSIVSVSRRFAVSTAGHRPFMTWRSLVVIGALMLCGALTVAAPSPILKLVAVLTALAVAFLLARIVPADQVASTLILAVLVLIVVNSAFRSLYPLLLDPHNLHGRW